MSNSEDNQSIKVLLTFPDERSSDIQVNSQSGIESLRHSQDKILLIGDMDYTTMRDIENLGKNILMISTTSMQPEISKLSTAFSICFDARLLAAFYIMMKECGTNLPTPTGLQKIIDEFGITVDEPIAPEIQSSLTILPMIDQHATDSYHNLLIEDVSKFIMKVPGLSQNFSKRYLMTLWNNFVLFDEDLVYSRFNIVDFHTSLPSHGRIRVQTLDRVFELSGDASDPFLKSSIIELNEPSVYTAILTSTPDAILKLSMINSEGNTVC